MRKLSIDDYILLNYKNKTNAQMALELGCNKSTISNHRKKLGISATDRNKQLREQIPYICSQYGKKTKKALAEELSCSKDFIEKIWSENKLNKGNKLTYPFNEHYFDTIDKLEKAYWLGFISADGCLYGRKGHQGMLCIGVNSKDIELLEQFKKELSSNKPISKTTDMRRKDTEMANLQLTSDILFNRLLDLGIGMRKTFNLYLNDIIKNIPKQFLRGYILGYFDGDGSIDIPTDHSISKSHVRISGPIRFLNQMQNILKEFFIDSSIIQDKRNYKEPFGSLELTSTVQKYNFLKWIYSDNVFSLTRKREKSLELIRRIENNTTYRRENIEAIENYKSVVLKREELLER